MGYLFIKISLQWPDVTICLIQQKSKPYLVKLIATMRGEIWQTAETRVHLWCCTNPPTSPRPCIAPRCLVKTSNQGSTIHHDVLHHSSLMFWTTTYSMKSQAFLTSKVTAKMRDWTWTCLFGADIYTLWSWVLFCSQKIYEYPFFRKHQELNFPLNRESN